MTFNAKTNMPTFKLNIINTSLKKKGETQNEIHIFTEKLSATNLGHEFICNCLIVLKFH
jgi:hypothetical protein